MHFLEELVKRICLAEPKDEMVAYEVKPDERVVGVLPQELRQFFVVYSEAYDRLNELSEKLQGSRRITKLQRQECAIERSRVEVVKIAFWTAVRRTFVEIIDDENIGIRQGWQVVTKKHVYKCQGCESRAACELMSFLVGLPDAG